MRYRHRETIGRYTPPRPARGAATRCSGPGRETAGTPRESALPTLTVRPWVPAGTCGQVVPARAGAGGAVAALVRALLSGSRHSTNEHAPRRRALSGSANQDAPSRVHGPMSVQDGVAVHCAPPLSLSVPPPSAWAVAWALRQPCDSAPRYLSFATAIYSLALPGGPAGRGGFQRQTPPRRATAATARHPRRL